MRFENKLKLNDWLNGLSKTDLKVILFECIEELIIAEQVTLSCGSPMWSNSGEFLDGHKDEYPEGY